jgi:hypothetical protein
MTEREMVGTGTKTSARPTQVALLLLRLEIKIALAAIQPAETLFAPHPSNSCDGNDSGAEPI